MVHMLVCLPEIPLGQLAASPTALQLTESSTPPLLVSAPSPASQVSRVLPAARTRPSRPYPPPHHPSLPSMPPTPWTDSRHRDATELILIPHTLSVHVQHLPLLLPLSAAAAGTGPATCWHLCCPRLAAAAPRTTANRAAATSKTVTTTSGNAQTVLRLPLLLLLR